MCIAIIGSVTCEAQLKSEIIQGRAEEIANWAASKMGDYAGISGDLFVQNVAAVTKTQEAEKFKFDMEVNFGFVNQEGSLKRCKLSVMDIPTENVRLFNEAPSCN